MKYSDAFQTIKPGSMYLIEPGRKVAVREGPAFLREGAEVEMENKKEAACRKGLRPGMIVKDRAGLFKEVTRIEGDKVYWHFTEKLKDTSPQEMASKYEEFADNHFITPLRAEGKSGVIPSSR